MNLKRILTRSLMALALLVPVAATGSVEASGGGPVPSHAVHVHYHVYYRSHGEHHWHFYGSYNSHSAAHHAAHDLQHQGYHTKITSGW